MKMCIFRMIPVGLATMFLGVLTDATVEAQPPGGGSPFDRFDANKDGRLTRDELPAFLRNQFERMDANKDGFISRAEDEAHFRRMRAGAGAIAGGRGGVVVPPGVTAKLDLNYADTKDPRQTLDVYVPKTKRGDKPLPVIVNIHGGAFKVGDKSMGVGGLLPLVASGEYAVVSINYRLSGQAIWPAQIHDCKAAIRWIRAYAKEYGWNPDAIGVIGGSAGGHLAAMLGTSGGVEALEGTVGKHQGVSSRVRCVVDQFGPADLSAMGGSHNDPNSPESELIGGAVPDHPDKARNASPITYVDRDDPPFLIIHGTKDPLVPFNQSERLAEKLKGVDSHHLFIPVTDGGHGGFRNPAVAKRIQMFFDKYLQGKDVGTITETPIAQNPNTES